MFAKLQSRNSIRLGIAVVGLICQPLSSAEPQFVEIPSALLTVVESVEVSASREGLLSIVAVSEGAVVSRGKLVAKIDDREARQSVTQAELEVQVAHKQATSDIGVRVFEKAHAVAVAELKRAQAVNDDFPKGVSLRELERLRLSADHAALQIEQARHDHEIQGIHLQLKEATLELAKLELENHSIASPLDGMVVEVRKRAGEWVRPGDPVARIVRMDRLRAEGFVDAEQALRLANCPATLVRDVPQQPRMELRGCVTFVSPDVNPVNRQVRVWAEFENSAKLWPGLRGLLRVEITPVATADAR